MESMKMCRDLEDGEAKIAGHHVFMIADRDTSVLDRDGIARAAVGMVVENALDRAVVPLLSAALLGPARGTSYKAVNTAGPAIGYKNDTYRFFGRTTVLLDNVLDLIPARIMGCLIVLAVLFTPGMDGMNGWCVFLRDRKKHASPSPAHGEVAYAGISHLCLVGDAWYFESLHKKSFIGEGDRPIVPTDIRRAN